MSVLGGHPLEGIAVFAIEQYGAGPYGSMLLPDLGAEVIKIEDPQTGGDVARYVPPFRGSADSLCFQAFNRPKKSVAIDTRDPRGRKLLEGSMLVRAEM